jgi:hypothetical protein
MASPKNFLLCLVFIKFGESMPRHPAHACKIDGKGAGEMRLGRLSSPSSCLVLYIITTQGRSATISHTFRRNSFGNLENFGKRWNNTLVGVDASGLLSRRTMSICICRGSPSNQVFITPPLGSVCAAIHLLSFRQD